MKLVTLPFVAALLAASSASPVLERRATAAVTASDLSSLKFYAQYAAAAYCNSENAAGQAISCSADACPTVMANGAVTIGTFRGLVTDIRGFVAVDLNAAAIVVSFRGSTSAANWIANLQFAQIPCDLVSDCYAHAGFLTAWKESSGAVLSAVSAARALHPSFRVVVTGHSLGGAVATLAAAYLRQPSNAPTVDLITYGSPRVGNNALAGFVTAQPGAEFRVTHVDDPVPKLPPIEFGYRHTSPEYWLSTGGATTTNYGVADVKVCQGSADLGCNAGTPGLNAEAHLYYFQAIAGCS